MDETILCPSCQAHLALSAAPAGQSVQCPRCQRVFEPARSALPRAAAIPVRPVQPVYDETEDADRDFDFGPRIHRRSPFPSEWKATLAMVLLGLGVLSCALQGYIQFEMIQIYELQDELERAPFFNDFEKADEIDRRLDNAEYLAGLAHPIHFLIFWAVLIGFLIWQHQASHNIRLLQVGGSTYSPGWGIVVYFLPLVNLYCPYAVVHELWRSSDPRATKTPNSWQHGSASLVVGAWWLLCLLALFLAYLGHTFDPAVGGGNGIGIHEFVGPDDQWNGALAWGLAHLCFCLAGLMQIYLVKEITRRQRERYTNLYDPL